MSQRFVPDTSPDIDETPAPPVPDKDGPTQPQPQPGGSDIPDSTSPAPKPEVTSSTPARTPGDNYALITERADVVTTDKRFRRARNKRRVWDKVVDGEGRVNARLVFFPGSRAFEAVYKSGEIDAIADLGMRRDGRMMRLDKGVSEYNARNVQPSAKMITAATNRAAVVFFEDTEGFAYVILDPIVQEQHDVRVSDTTSFAVSLISPFIVEGGVNPPRSVRCACRAPPGNLGAGPDDTRRRELYLNAPIDLVCALAKEDDIDILVHQGVTQTPLGTLRIPVTCDVDDVCVERNKAVSMCTLSRIEYKK